jgi:hypothetical protein
MSDAFGGDPFCDNTWAVQAGPGDGGEPAHPVADDGLTTTDVAQTVAGTVVAYLGLKAVRQWWRRRGYATEQITPVTPVPATVAPSVSSRPAAEPDRQAAQDDRSRTDRAVLVEFCVDLERLLPQPALREKVHRALARVGVTAEVPTGAPFDPDRHCAVGTVPTADPDRHDRIASVESCGFRDGERELRNPDVVVWRYDATFDPAEEPSRGGLR